MNDSKGTVKVYVRGEEMRQLSFQRPQDIPQKDFLAFGMPIDGNSALAQAGWYPNGAGWGHSIPCVGDSSRAHEEFTSALLCVEQSLSSWLAQYGYETEFV